MNRYRPTFCPRLYGYPRQKGNSHSGWDRRCIRWYMSFSAIYGLRHALEVLECIPEHTFTQWNISRHDKGHTAMLTIWIDLEDIMLCEVSQRETGK